MSIENDHSVGLGQPDLFEQIETFNWTKIEFGDEEVRLFFVEKLKGISRRRCRNDLDGTRLQMLGSPVKKVGVVISDNDRLFLDICHKGLKIKALKKTAKFPP